MLHKIDSDGRQRICFMLKTVSAHEAEEATFINCNNNNVYNSSTNAAAGNEDDDSMMEETIGDVRAELDEKLATFANDINKHSVQMQSTLENNVRAHTDNLKKEMFEGMSEMFKQMVEQMQELQMQINNNNSEYDADNDDVGSDPDKVPSAY